MADNNKRSSGRPAKRRSNLGPFNKAKVSRVDEVDSAVENQRSQCVYVSNSNEDIECRTILASISQSDPKFEDFSGRQCITIACVAIVLKSSKCVIEYLELEDNGKELPKINWKSSDLDWIIESGSNLFKVSISQLKKPKHFLSFDEIFTYFEVDRKLYHFYDFLTADPEDIKDLELNE